MARVTIEDSLENCPNLFSLIQLASKRAHQLQHGAEAKIDRAPDEKGIEDAPTVLALREIAAGFTNFDNEIIPTKDPFAGKGVDSMSYTTVKELPVVATNIKPSKEE